ELVGPTAARQRSVNCREDEAIAAGAVDGAAALVLRLGARDYEPIVARAVEVQAPCLEVELRLPAGDVSAVLVFGHEAKVCLAGGRVECAGVGEAGPRGGRGAGAADRLRRRSEPRDSHVRGRDILHLYTRHAGPYTSILVCCRDGDGEAPGGIPRRVIEVLVA